MPKSLRTMIEELDWQKVYQNPKKYYQKFDEINTQNLQHQSDITLSLNILQKIKLVQRLKAIDNFQENFEIEFEVHAEKQYNNLQYDMITKDNQESLTFIDGIKNLLANLISQMPDTLQKAYQLETVGQLAVTHLPHQDVNYKNIHHIPFITLGQIANRVIQKGITHEIFKQKPKKVKDTIALLDQNTNLLDELAKAWFNFIKIYYHLIQKLRDILIKNYEQSVVKANVYDLPFFIYIDTFKTKVNKANLSDIDIQDLFG